jgi:hypothetical protein
MFTKLSDKGYCMKDQVLSAQSYSALKPLSHTTHGCLISLAGADEDFAAAVGGVDVRPGGIVSVKGSGVKAAGKEAKSGAGGKHKEHDKKAKQWQHGGKQPKKHKHATGH